MKDELSRCPSESPEGLRKRMAPHVVHTRRMTGVSRRTAPGQFGHATDERIGAEKDNKKAAEGAENRHRGWG